MRQETKAGIYIAVSTAVVALFFSVLRLYLLQSPPNTIALLTVAHVAAALMYCIVFGPVWILRMNIGCRLNARRILRQTFLVCITGFLVSLIIPGIPRIAPAAFVSFATIMLMLRTVAIYVPRRPVLSV